MKKFIFIFLLMANTCFGQEWVAEVMVGAAGYNGDLTQQRISYHTMRPVVNFNIKYNTGNFINYRAGIGFGAVAGNDKYNSSATLKNRNLNFETYIFEANAAVEIPLLDPVTFYAYPYVFAGVGVFHFNPYTNDNTGKKTFLRPLSTEGEGLSQYPGRKKYSLTQICIPVGLGWKFNINEKWEICYEFGYRFLFTDYLDDVSKTYVDLNVLSQAKGPIAAELAYRGKTSPPQVDGLQRGNPNVKDSYFFTGIKLGFKLGKSQPKYKY